MSNPHVCSRDSEAWMLFPRHIWNHMCGDTCRTKHKVRIILKQPSPHWKQFGIENLDFIPAHVEKPLTEISNDVSCYELPMLT